MWVLILIFGISNFDFNIVLFKNNFKGCITFKILWLLMKPVKTGNVLTIFIVKLVQRALNNVSIGITVVDS